MITRAGDIYCEQGESFTLGFRIVNQDGSPFVLSDALDDAKHKSYLLFTVASSVNITGEDRYLANFWNPTDKYKKFYSTQAIELVAEPGETIAWQNAWNKVADIISKDKSLANVTPKPTPVNYAIYYTVEDDGTRVYRQIVARDDREAASADNYNIKNYEFQFYQHITKEISNEWSQSGYYYALKVVSGTINSDEDGRPINVEFSYPLIGAHKLYVDTNVQGSLDLWKDAKEVNK